MTESELNQYESKAQTYPRPMVGEAPGDVILKLVTEVRTLNLGINSLVRVNADLLRANAVLLAEVEEEPEEFVEEPEAPIVVASDNSVQDEVTDIKNSEFWKPIFPKVADRPPPSDPT